MFFCSNEFTTGVIGIELDSKEKVGSNGNVPEDPVSIANERAGVTTKKSGIVCAVYCFDSKENSFENAREAIDERRQAVLAEPALMAIRVRLA